MWYVYILYSESIDAYYTGVTENDLNWRLQRHNMGWGKYTKRGIPWKIVYSEKFADKKEALSREREIKNKKSQTYIKKLITNG